LGTHSRKVFNPGDEEEGKKERNVGSRKRREVIYPLPTPLLPLLLFKCLA
jgi:hypothetical protein